MYCTLFFNLHDFSINMCFFSNVDLEAVASLHTILYSFAVVFVDIFALGDVEKKLLYLIYHFSA